MREPTGHGGSAAPAHGHGHGGGVEPDVQRVGMVAAFGVALFLAVIVAIGALGGYFWWERARASVEKVNDVSLVGEQMREIRAREQDRLTKYEKLEDGRYRIPIERAMELVVRDGL